MAFHQGLRLKKFIEKSDYKILDVVKKTGIANSSLFDIFKKEELSRSKILPILNLIGMTYEDFIGNATSTELADLKKENELLKNENIQLLKDKINLLEQLQNETVTNKKNPIHTKNIV